MTCAVCGCEFCWLCMKEISDLHYLRYRLISEQLLINAFNVKLHCILLLFIFSCFFPSFQSIRLYILGEKAMESKEKDSVAARHSDRRASWHHADRWHCNACHGHWHSSLRRKEGEILICCAVMLGP